MSPFFKNFGSVIISLISAIVIIISALVWKDTEYENAWLYIFCVTIVVQPLWEAYVKRSK